MKKQEVFDPDKHFPESPLELENKKIEPKSQSLGHYYRTLMRDLRMGNLPDKEVGPLTRLLGRANFWEHHGFDRIALRNRFAVFAQIHTSASIGGWAVQELNTQRSKVQSEEEREIRAIGKGALRGIQKQASRGGYFR